MQFKGFAMCNLQILLQLFPFLHTFFRLSSHRLKNSVVVMCVTFLKQELTVNSSTIEALDSNDAALSDAEMDTPECTTIIILAVYGGVYYQSDDDGDCRAAASDKGHR